MASLTPLRFTRTVKVGPTSAPVASPSNPNHLTYTMTVKEIPQYGLGQYQTACGRFILIRTDERQWRIQRSFSTTHPGQVFHFLNAVGLLNARFETRADALECLQSICDAHEVPC